MNNEFEMIAKTFKGLEEVLAKELVDLGANNIQIQRRAVSFTGNLKLMYEANYHLRTASRILKPILTFRAKDADEIYTQVKKFNWEKFMNLSTTFAIDSTVFSDDFRHSKFVSYRVKDGIADFFTEKYDKRPNVSIDNPKLMINVHIAQNQCTISLDSSGDSLHKRGYRERQTEAPINEALAAGMLLLAGWDGKMNFIDPMCGSGTFLIEAALIALNIPPGIYRENFAFENWLDFDLELFELVCNDDSAEREFEYRIYGSDISIQAVKTAERNIRGAGLGKYISVQALPLKDLEIPDGKFLMVTNPPYGERISPKNISEIYKTLGTVLKHKFAGNSAWVISSNEEFLHKIGLKPSKKIELLNGSLECLYCKYEIFEGKRNEFLRKKQNR
ncbi:MAG: class I SAM-dependent RNA methyltransferase [Porphyromonadaceae bacterium]|nr:class I SAM-dependent RNA methyltransferase [Porphyromonadaceae bacterium]